MKRLILAVATLHLLSCFAFAGTKEDLARDVIKLTDLQKMTDQVVTQVQQMQASQLKTLDVPKERQAEAAEFQNKVYRKITEKVNWKSIEDEYAAFLVSVYTEEELKAILGFYKMPVGQTILQKEPIMMGKIMVLMQARIQSVLPEVQKMTRDFTESIKKIK